MLIEIMDEIYRLTPAAWRRYYQARANGQHPAEPARGWKHIGSPMNVLDMEDADFAELIRFMVEQRT